MARLKDEAARQRAEIDRAMAAARKQFDADKVAMERSAEEKLKAERALTAQLERERDQSREEAGRLTGEKAGLTERVAKAEHLLATMYATLQTVVIPPNRDPTVMGEFAHYMASATSSARLRRSGSRSVPWRGTLKSMPSPTLSILSWC